mgnify:CR=1 FL=1
MKKIISVLFLILTFDVFANDNLSLNFARGDLFVSAEVSESELYPKSSITVNITLSHIENADLQFSVRDLPVIGGHAFQYDRRTIFGSSVKNGIKYITKKQEVLYFFDRSGMNQIPSISLDISGLIRGKKLEGRLATDPLPLKIEPIKETISFSGLNSQIELSTDIDSERTLNKGDSVKYEITLSSEGTTSLYLPQRNLLDEDGAIYYYKQISSKDSSNRGVNISTVKYEVTVIYNRAGDFKHSISPIYFYNLSTNEIDTLELEFPDVHISGIYISKLQKRLLIFLFVSFLILFGFYYNYRESLHRFLNKRARKKERLSLVKKSIHEKKYQECISLFYKSLDEFKEGEYVLISTLKKLGIKDLHSIESLLSNLYSVNETELNNVELVSLFKDLLEENASGNNTEIKLEINS